MRTIRTDVDRWAAEVYAAIDPTSLRVACEIIGDDEPGMGEILRVIDGMRWAIEAPAETP